MTDLPHLERTRDDEPRSGRAHGKSLIEALLTVALIASLILVTLPHLGDARRSASLRALTGQLTGLLSRCRALALTRHQSTALVFDPADPWTCVLAVDGDGDGVRRDDLDRGTDQTVGPRVRLRHAECDLGILRSEQVPDPLGGGFLGGNLDDPVRAGRGDIVTFGALGTATPSSIFLTDHRAQMRVVRVFGATGRTRTMTWKVGWSEWRQGWW
jgi:hypothetical protein